MPEWLLPFLGVAGTGWTLVGVCALAVFRGWWVPRTQIARERELHQQLVDRLDKQIADQQQAIAASDARADRLAHSMERLLTGFDTLRGVVERWASATLPARGDGA